MKRFRCKTCLQPKKDCVCHEMTDKSPKSDWAVISQRPPKLKPKIYTTTRLAWLEELEAKSVVDKKQLIESKFSKEQEMMFFWFNTFNIFKKKDIKMVEFYLKN